MEMIQLAWKQMLDQLYICQCYLTFVKCWFVVLTLPQTCQAVHAQASHL
jgi:hypothetical protein